MRDSEVRFRGEQPIDPALDVSAEREISGVTAQVKVTGTARQPAIRLSSSPPLDEGDVLSLIVFGQPMNQLGESQQFDLAARAGMFAASAVATPLSRSIGRALNLICSRSALPARMARARRFRWAARSAAGCSSGCTRSLARTTSARSRSSTVSRRSCASSRPSRKARSRYTARDTPIRRGWT
jgi:translocation and assembly module TamB